MQGFAQHQSKEKLQAEYPLHNLLDDWFFKVVEVSNNLYEAQGINTLGMTVSRKGGDENETLTLVVSDAQEVSASVPDK